MRKPIDKTYYISQTYIQLEKNLHQSQDRSRGFVQSCPEVHSRTGSDGAQRYCHIYQPLSIRIERQYMADASEMQKECKRLEARNLEIYDMILSIYTDEVKCVLSEQWFVKLTAALEQDQEEKSTLFARTVANALAIWRSGNLSLHLYSENSAVCYYSEIGWNGVESSYQGDSCGWSKVKKVNRQKTKEVRNVYSFVGENSYPINKQ